MERLVLGISKEENKIFLVMAVLLLIWFAAIVSYFNVFMESNFMIGYTIMIVLLSYFSFRYILKFGNPADQINLFIAYVIVFFIHDLFLYPYLVTQSGLVNAPIQTIASSDVFIWKLLPESWAPMIKYFVVYVGATTLGFFIARILAGREKFRRML